MEEGYEMEEEFDFESGAGIIKQFLLLLLDFRNTVNRDTVVIDDAMWSHMLSSVMSRLQKECYLYNEASPHHTLYRLKSIIHDGGKCPDDCILYDSKVTVNDIDDSTIVLDVEDSIHTIPYMRKLKKYHPDKITRRFVDVAYKYSVQNFETSMDCAFVNTMLMYNLIQILNDEILDTYYTLIGLPSVEFDCTSMTLMRNVTINTFLTVLSSSYDLELPSAIVNSFDYLPEDARGFIHMTMVSKYDRNEFDYDGTDLFKCKSVPFSFNIGVR